ncbi:hypothetical protein PROFUN_08108 [Planoprotostelium fungivorum]|uniref:Uncharacterized protein n=1 Tax=Planoprotostelium fungivorum TaxID=1890364 RepID=A0A2P6NKF2_9EUKA|nr:hypothetical protein PROFUN_08108 [Planoprotostelium fungivorum]
MSARVAVHNLKPESPSAVAQPPVIHNECLSYYDAAPYRFQELLSMQPRREPSNLPLLQSNSTQFSGPECVFHLSSLHRILFIVHFPVCSYGSDSPNQAQCTSDPVATSFVLFILFFMCCSSCCEGSKSFVSYFTSESTFYIFQREVFFSKASQISDTTWWLN